MTNHDNKRYDEQITTALGRIDSSDAFVTLDSRENGECGLTYGIDDDIYSTNEEVVAQQLQLLGNHIRHLETRLGTDITETIKLALRATEHFAIEGEA